MGGALGPLLQVVVQDAYGLLMDTVQEGRRAKRAARAAAPPPAESGPPPIPEIPGIPSLDLPALAISAAAVAAAPAMPPAARPVPSVADSYAAEMDDPGVACKPCTMRHLTTIHEAARTAAASGDPEVWRAQVALIAAEATVWEEYDLTPGKLARASAEVRAAVTAAQPRMRALLASLQLAPDRLNRAWGALL